MTDIADLFRKGMLAGIGAISLTTDKAQEIVNELVERGEMTREQGTSMTSELLKRGEETRNQFREMIKSELRKALDEASIPSKDDLKRLEAKIDILLSRISGPAIEPEDIT